MEIGVEIPFLHINQVTSIPFCGIEKLLNETAVSREESFQHMMVKAIPLLQGLWRMSRLEKRLDLGKFSHNKLQKNMDKSGHYG